MGHNERRAIAQAEWRNVTNRDRWQTMADEYNEKMIETKYKDKPKPPVTANAFFFRENHRVLRVSEKMRNRMITCSIPLIKCKIILIVARESGSTRM